MRYLSRSHFKSQLELCITELILQKQHNEKLVQQLKNCRAAHVETLKRIIGQGT